MATSTDELLVDMNSTMGIYTEEVEECEWPDPMPEGLYCPPERDAFQCWQATPANSTVYGPCPATMGFSETVLAAHRTCNASGKWERLNWTNYSACVDYVGLPGQQHEHDIRLARVLSDIYFVASIISLAFLLLSLFIFCYFRSLQCSRISIHKNLVLSFIFRFILIIIMFEPFISMREHSYRDIDWLCKVFTALRQYTIMANFSWMLVEGIFLHNRLVVSVFRSDAPFKLFYFIGWGVPAVITCTWATLMHYFFREKCWNKSTQSPFIFIIYAPILVALVINLAFLINIIRVLVTKLRTHNTNESRRIRRCHPTGEQVRHAERRAIKATIVLLPLLGITNLVFFAKPADEDSFLMTVYRIINAILPSCQGVFVTVLYCFMNTEVQSVIRKKWKRFQINRAMNSRMRRRSSRTSSFFLSQSEVVFMVSFRKKKVWSKPSRAKSRRLAPRDISLSRVQSSMPCTCLDEHCTACGKELEYMYQL